MKHYWATHALKAISTCCVTWGEESERQYRCSENDRAHYPFYQQLARLAAPKMIRNQEARHHLHCMNNALNVYQLEE